MAEKFRFTRREVAPRWAEIVLRAPFLVGITSAITATVWSVVGPVDAPWEQATYRDLAGATLTFSGISFGAAMTCVAVTLAWPRDSLLEAMVSTTTQAPSARAAARSTYKDLMFVFLWTAYVQLGWAIVSALCLTFMSNAPLVPNSFHMGATIGLSLIVFFSLFGLLQLAAALRALSSLVRLRDKYLRRDLTLPTPATESQAPSAR